MKYQGSKNKIAKKLFEVIKCENKNWIEPFVGGCGMISNLPKKSAENDVIKLASDNNKYIISLWKAVQLGWEPPYITKEEYNDIKLNPDNFSEELVAFTAIGCSFRGGWFNGYSGKTQSRDYIDESRRALIKLRPKILDVTFIHCNYYELEMPPPDNSIIYCDPPYANTKKYKDSFNNDKFWEWCRIKSNEGYQIYISEYKAPKDFKCILEIQRTQTMSHQKQQGIVTTEKLFTI